MSRADGLGLASSSALAVAAAMREAGETKVAETIELAAPRDPLPRAPQSEFVPSYVRPQPYRQKIPTTPGDFARLASAEAKRARRAGARSAFPNARRAARRVS